MSVESIRTSYAIGRRFPLVAVFSEPGAVHLPGGRRSGGCWPSGTAGVRPFARRKKAGTRDRFAVKRELGQIRLTTRDS